MRSCGPPGELGRRAAADGECRPVGWDGAAPRRARGRRRAGARGRLRGRSAWPER
ncbi:hypothetical protein ACFPM0_04990 [Pseudonocardia sulfidoxydans]|uniref:hypothetical protein n=1 Tax=Pseudonocardia sulfidoxydans TaxID=54011 RepID=UPI00361FB805